MASIPTTSKQSIVLASTSLGTDEEDKISYELISVPKIQTSKLTQTPVLGPLQLRRNCNI